MASLASIKPVLVLDPDQTSFSQWEEMLLPSAIGTIDPQKVGELFLLVRLMVKNLTQSTLQVTEQLKILIDADDLDSIFFLSPGMGGLITHVSDALGLFKSKVNVVVPYEESTDGLDLRLDSRLYLYQLQQDGKVTLFESYQIR